MLYEKIKNLIFRKIKLEIKKTFFFSFLIALIIVFLVLFIYWPRDMSHGKTPIYGLNFSEKYAMDLGLDWREAYLAILNELQPKRMRISAHWDLIEKERNVYDFSDLDWQIEEAAKRNIEIILAIGRRTPRWPECHTPNWAQTLDENNQEEYTISLLKKEIEHFQKYDNIVYWQVENEPFLNIFGECPDGNEKFLDKEIAVARLLSDKPIVLTDSGELSTWRKLAKKADILGTSMYKTVWNPYWGFFTYPLPASYYYYKAEINKFFNKNLQKVIITELQGEAWANAPLVTIPIQEQYRSMDINKLKNNIEYARLSGLNEIYLWGAEWWYWLKLTGNDSFWREVQNVFINNNLANENKTTSIE